MKKRWFQGMGFGAVAIVAFMQAYHIWSQRQYYELPSVFYWQICIGIVSMSISLFRLFFNR